VIGRCHLPEESRSHFTESVSIDGGMTWHTVYSWTGDFETGREWFLHKISLDWMLGFSNQLRWKVTVVTNDDVVNTSGSELAGVFIDDSWVESCAFSRTEESSSWGKIKSMYR
jgi:hypothetical protein